MAYTFCEREIKIEKNFLRVSLFRLGSTYIILKQKPVLWISSRITIWKARVRLKPTSSDINASYRREVLDMLTQLTYTV